VQRTGDVPAVVHSNLGIYPSAAAIPYNRLIHQSRGGARGEPRYVNIGVREGVPHRGLRGAPHEPDDPIRDPAGSLSFVRRAAPIQAVGSRTKPGAYIWPRRDGYVGR